MEKISLAENQVTTPNNASGLATPIQETKPNVKKFIPLFVVMIIAGSLVGFLLAKNRAASLVSTGGTDTAQDGTQALKPGMKFGSSDESTFRDKAEGVLQLGGVDGEGSHHLVRPGGPAQNVYLTSSVVDLDLFEGHKIRVWGETVGAKKAGWLMDAGKVEVLELNAKIPE